jgi:benzoyl-CoA reductase/2-hydroxyglutaryl-CoA dehydratase subunit BcrC/BadD/HgdB
VKDCKVDLIQQMYEKLRGVIDYMTQKYPERVYLYEPALKYFELANEGIMQGKPVLWYYFCLPPELFRALEVTAVSPEYLAGGLAAMGDRNRKYVDMANEKFADHICTINKSPVGLALSGDTLTPDMMVYTAVNPCDAALISYSNIGHYLNIPSFQLDTPYLSDDRSRKYMAKQISDMFSFIEGQTGQKLDLDRLREIIGYSNQSLDYLLKLNELSKNIPSPTSSRALYVSSGATMALSGLPFFVDWSRKRYEVAKEKAERGEGALPAEKVRLVFIANGFDVDLNIFDWLEQKYGAVMVASLLNMYPTDPIDNTGDMSKIFEGLARRTMAYPMARHGRGSADYYIDECIRVAGDYRADAVVFSCNTGCKYNWATAQLVRNAIYDKLGIPTLVFEIDPWDPSVAASESIKSKFEQFFDVAF